jgi:hypothetical protein
LAPGPVGELYAPDQDTVDFRTVLKQYLLDPVLPIVTLLAIGALTVVLLLLLVTAVANLEQVVQGSSGVSNDPWSATAGCTDQQAYAAYVASGAATAERDFGSGPQSYGTADDPYVRTSAPR